MEVWNKEKETAVEFVSRLSKQENKKYIPLMVNGKKKNTFVYGNCLAYKKRMGSGVAYYINEEVNSLVYKEPKSKEEVFNKGLTTALKYLNQSGLWDNVKRDIKEMLSIGYEASKAREDLRSTFWMFDRPKIKAISLGNKYRTQEYRQMIQDAYNNKKPLSFRWQAGYGLSFEYNPEKNKAWWSEEYRGCGNGHYYLMLDNKHALFCEDD